MRRTENNDSGLASLADLCVSGLTAGDPLVMQRPTAGMSDSSDSRSPSESCVVLSAAMQAAVADGYDPVLWLGQGRFMEAWRCVDRSLDREVVIKAMRVGCGVSPAEAEALLLAEAEVLGKLSHRGIVRVVHRAGAGDTSYLALDYIDGDDLLSHCRLCSLGPEDRLAVFGRFLETVVYLHKKAVVHGDLKPEHILVCEDGLPVLIDFGLAGSRHNTACLSLGGERVGGSGQYRAPEIVDGSAWRRECQQDVYAMGILLRDLLAGVDTGSLHHPLLGIIDQATATLPAERLPDAEAFQAALQDVLEIRLLDDSDSDSTSRNGGKLQLQGVLLAVSIIVLTFVTTGMAWMIDGRTQPVQAERQRFQPRAPITLSARAIMLEGIASHINRGQAQQADEALNALLAEDPGAGSAWEVRHLKAGIDGQAYQWPFGESPYGETFVVSVAYDPASQTLAYIRVDEDQYEIWTRCAGGSPQRVATTKRVIRAVSMSPGGGRIATLEGAGYVALRSVSFDGPASTASGFELHRAPDARLVWFSQDGRAIYLFSPSARTVERWSAADPHATGPQKVFHDCDHAYPLPSGDGSFLLATAGAETYSGNTRLRLIAHDGAVLRRVEMPVNQLPTSADAAPSVDGQICLGMPDGFVLVYNSDDEAWLPPCDLGRNEDVPVVLYCPVEGRIFAGSSRVHVIDTVGQLMMRLGDRDGIQQLITGLHYDSQTGALTSFSPYRIHQWLATPKPR